SRTTFLLVNYCSLIDGGSGSDNPTIYSATSELIEDIGIMTAKCGIQLHPEHKFRNTERFAAIAQHSQTIANRIGGMDRVTRLQVSWGLEVSASELEKQKQMDALTSPLTQFEKAYLEGQQLAYPWRYRFNEALDLRVVECMATVLELESPGDKEDIFNIAVALENLMNYKSAFFEKHLAARYPSRHIFHQWAQRLEVWQAGKARSEALTTRIAKYQRLAGTAENNYSDLPKKVMVVTDIDDNSLKRLPRVEPSPWWPDSVIALLELEQVQVDHRLALWKDSTSSSKYLAEAIFAAYPSATCANDPELFAIMAARGCAVFGFADEKTISAPAFDKLPIEHGVSLLRCSQQWVPQLTDLVQSNPHILALQISDGGDDELDRAVERNRRDWGANTSNLSDGISRFCFADGFEACGDIMLMPGKEATGFLLIKTDRAGTWRVNFWHSLLVSRASHLSVSLTLRSQVTGDTTLLGTMEILPTEEFKRDSLTVELPAGVHQINLRFFEKDDPLGFYLLRKVWATRMPPETEQDISAAGDETVLNEVHAEVKEPVQSGGIHTTRRSSYQSSNPMKPRSRHRADRARRTIRVATDQAAVKNERFGKNTDLSGISGTRLNFPHPNANFHLANSSQGSDGIDSTPLNFSDFEHQELGLDRGVPLLIELKFWERRRQRPGSIASLNGAQGKCNHGDKDSGNSESKWHTDVPRSRAAPHQRFLVYDPEIVGIGAIETPPRGYGKSDAGRRAPARTDAALTRTGAAVTRRNGPERLEGAVYLGGSEIYHPAMTAWFGIESTWSPGQDSTVLCEGVHV
ncbi:hypothetical protein C8F04DRAFT_1318369, partial [Mycena alexandri]